MCQNIYLHLLPHFQNNMGMVLFWFVQIILNHSEHWKVGSCNQEIGFSWNCSRGVLIYRVERDDVQCSNGEVKWELQVCVCACYLCRRADVILTAMFSQATVLSPFPAASQPSRLQHSSNTQSHLWPAGTTYWPNRLNTHTFGHFNKPNMSSRWHKLLSCHVLPGTINNDYTQKDKHKTAEQN